MLDAAVLPTAAVALCQMASAAIAPNRDAAAAHFKTVRRFEEEFITSVHNVAQPFARKDSAGESPAPPSSALPFNPAHQNRVGPAADIAEATARADKAAKRAQICHVVH